MITAEKTIKSMQYASEIIEIFEQYDNLTTSDLQSALQAIVLNIMNDK
jgi:hypothetical protein